jgi:hypothetical protein
MAGKVGRPRKNPLPETVVESPDVADVAEEVEPSFYKTPETVVFADVGALIQRDNAGEPRNEPVQEGANYMSTIYQNALAAVAALKESE